MKKYIFAVAFILSLVCVLQAQETVVQDTILPEKIVKDFTKRYPKASTEDWRKEGDNYIISYFNDNNWFDVSYSVSGKWVQTAILIDYEGLPEAIRKNFEQSKFAGLEIVKITVAEKPKAEKQYKIYLETRDQKERLLLYSESGALLSE